MPISSPFAAAPAPGIEYDRAIIIERLSAAFPRWLISHDGRIWNARRRGNFRAGEETAAYLVSDADRHVFLVNLAAEDSVQLDRQTWDLA